MEQRPKFTTDELAWPEVTELRKELTILFSHETAVPFNKTSLRENSSGGIRKFVIPVEWDKYTLTSDELRVITKDSKKIKWSSASDWTSYQLSALHIVPSYVADYADLVPSKFIPSEDEIKSLYPLLMDVTENQIRNLDSDPYFKDKAVDARSEDFLQNLCKIARKESMTTGEDKHETFTDLLFGSWVRLNSNVDRIGSDYKSYPQFSGKLILGMQNAQLIESEVISDWVLKYHELNTCFVWEESKRKLHGKSEDFLNGQRAAEILCAANYNLTSQFKPQEIFGINLTHTSAGFWYCCVPSAYLSQMKSGSNFANDQVLEFRGFQGAQNGIHGKIPTTECLNLLNPAKRLLAFRLLWGIINYTRSGCAYVGDYDIDSIKEARMKQGA